MAQTCETLLKYCRVQIFLHRSTAPFSSAFALMRGAAQAHTCQPDILNVLLLELEWSISVIHKSTRRCSIFSSFPPDTADASTSGYPCTAEYGAPVMPSSVLGGYPGMQGFYTMDGPRISQRAPTEKGGEEIPTYYLAKFS